MRLPDADTLLPQTETWPTPWRQYVRDHLASQRLHPHEAARRIFNALQRLHMPPRRSSGWGYRPYYKPLSPHCPQEVRAAYWAEIRTREASGAMFSLPDAQRLGSIEAAVMQVFVARYGRTAKNDPDGWEMVRQFVSCICGSHAEGQMFRSSYPAVLLRVAQHYLSTTEDKHSANRRQAQMRYAMTEFCAQLGSAGAISPEDAYRMQDRVSQWR
jgi:hypothetical protein